MKINDRVKELRKALKLTQTEFGERVDAGQSYLASIEKGDRDVTEKITRLVCLEFNVNEDWLRYGQGEMFVESNSTIISELSTEYNLDSIDVEIVKGYLELDSEQRKAIKNYVCSIANAINSEVAAAKDDEDDIEKELASYRLELEAEKKGKISKVSGSGKNIG